MYGFIRRVPTAVKLAAVSITTLSLSLNAGADTYFVKPNGPNGNGLSWNTAFNNPSLALAAAAAHLGPDDVWVAAGVYTPGTSQSSVFTFHRDVKVFGGFLGTEQFEFQRNPAVNATILSADRNGNDVSGDESTYSDNCFTVVKFPNLLGNEINSVETHLDGFTIRGARNTSGSGGGIICSNAGPLIRGCTITDNRALFYGGGLYHEFGSPDKNPVLRNCTVSMNNAGADGGGVYCSYDTLILNSSLEGNRAERGAGLFNATTSGFVMVSSRVISNIATDVTTTPTVEASGGGIHLASTSAAGNASVINCLFASNSAVSDFAEGGGIWTGKLALHLSNCTVADNWTSSPLNFASGGGATITNSGSRVENAIFWGNDADFEPGLSAVSGVKVNYSDLQEVWTGASDCSPATCNISSNPAFVNAGTGNYRLVCGSPCINKGSDLLVPVDGENVDEDTSLTEPTPDRDLKWRTMEVADMGAFEKQPGSGCKPGDVSPSPCGNDVVDIDDLLVVINTWGQDCDVMACYGDANGNGIVDIDDLLQVINGWGPCGMTVSAPQTVQDCINICSEAPTTEEYQGCMNKCLLAIGEEP